MIEKVLLTPLNIIKNSSGDVLHAMKRTDDGFNVFGEAYFSEIEHKAVKAWKRHREMTLNLIVPTGAIRFVLFDDRENVDGKIWQIVLSRDNYQRLTVPPMVWVGFQGASSGNSMLLNIANIVHNPCESDVMDIEAIKFNWEE